MAKKSAIIIIIILLVITVVVYVGIWNARKEITVKQNKPASTEQPATETAKNTATGETAQPADSDVSAIEADLNSVSDDSFGENTLSDTEVGL